jgi:hypothetical protein
MPLTVVRLWLLVTAVIVTGLALWAFFPIVIFVLLLTVALGVASALMIGIARLLRGWLERRG